MQIQGYVHVIIAVDPPGTLMSRTFSYDSTHHHNAGVLLTSSVQDIMTQGKNHLASVHLVFPPFQVVSSDDTC